ncbi:hypothetical protein P3G55_06495 [Leptospira sp. 96542]|nr:hypothetical protein [Leptospira sp. 96542]
MLKNLYILSEGSWGIKSSEVFADLFYFLSTLTLFVYCFFHLAAVLWVPFVVSILLFVVFYILLKNSNYDVYWLGFITQVLLLFLITPAAFVSTSLLSLSIFFAAALYFFLNQYYELRIPILILTLFFLFFWDGVFGLMGVSLRNTNLFELPKIVELENTVIPFSYPLGSKIVWSPVAFGSLLESWGVYLLVSISWLAFRRSILFLYILGWFLVFGAWFLGNGSFGLLTLVSFVSLGVILHTIPGRNFYGSFYISVAMFFILVPISFLVGKFGICAMMSLLIFFVAEVVVTRVFLGK